MGDATKGRMGKRRRTVTQDEIELGVSNSRHSVV
jgi:hypothetical protein